MIFYKDNISNKNNEKRETVHEIKYIWQND